jgi:hypothetical protein
LRVLPRLAVWTSEERVANLLKELGYLRSD